MDEEGLQFTCEGTQLTMEAYTIHDEGEQFTMS